MVPFENTWPYERLKDDLYMHTCPSCGSGQVILPFKEKDLASIRSGQKKLLVMPCCRTSYKIVDADDDYLLAETRMRP
jgi:hypothetical protein